MEKECMNCGGSIYFQCRKEAAKYNDRLSSREGASEMLNVSVSSLSNYELGLTPVPTDVVVRMADLYGAPELEACYCKNDCPMKMSDYVREWAEAFKEPDPDPIEEKAMQILETAKPVSIQIPERLFDKERIKELEKDLIRAEAERDVFQKLYKEQLAIS